MFIILWSALARAGGATCPSPVEVVVWTAALQGAEDAFARLDEQGFDEAMASAAEELACLSEVVPPPIAARYHRLVGLRRFVREDEAGARLAFAAARAVDPFGALPSALLPPGHEARALADSASTPGDTAPAPRPRQGELTFDGSAGRRRPTDRPTLLQLSANGVVTRSVYLGPTDPLPDYPSGSASVAHWALGGGGAALVAGGAVTYAFAVDAATTLRGDLPDTTTRSDVVALRDRANGLTAASAAAGVLGLVAVGVAVVRW